ncbi:MAG TPA: bifunctional DNA-binding transcriptional regulator/O6-methylguanine-DNA methyltransferase Ada [Stellaceae bacterium]|nr:bifunctional DNA-binding transcriptional regulator/O6-methylguanine-DNA methyltransferase Ada [Stellaceae bacterium]
MSPLLDTDPPLSTLDPDATRWQVVLRRDASADGTFYYSVRTTGVYCRPSCPSRLARRENVAFHASREAAERAGFRPCKRCRPDEPTGNRRHAEAIAAACRLIEAAEEPPALAELAEAVGLSPFHFHRVFKTVTGVTPRAYAAALRTRRVRDGLATSATVTEAIYDAGFNASSRFYEQSAGMLGMTPGTFRRGGTDTEIRFAVGQCSLGAVLVAATDKGVCAIQLGDDPDQLVHDLQDRFPKAILEGRDIAFKRMVAQVVGFVEAPRQGLDLPLDVRGTAFQQRVWQALRQIPSGQTASYAEIAARIGAPSAVRAVAGACAANPAALAIPCHRVVRTDGSLSGYRWGVERKRVLLQREGAR